MDIKDWVTIFSLLIAFASLIVSYFMQKDERKLNHLEHDIRDLDKEKRHLLRELDVTRHELLKSVKCNTGFLEVEKKVAQEMEMEVALFRRTYRKDVDLFDRRFIEPQALENFLKKIEKGESLQNKNYKEPLHLSEI